MSLGPQYLHRPEVLPYDLLKLSLPAAHAVFVWV